MELDLTKNPPEYGRKDGAGGFTPFVDTTTTQTIFNKTFASSAFSGGTLNNTVGTELSEVVTAENALLAGESGSVFYLNAAAGFLTTLPAPALGVRYRFVVHTATSSNGYTIGTNGGANILYGMFLERAGTAGVAGSAQDLITLVNASMVKGDWFEIRSDGTSWYVFGMTDIAAGVTFGVT